MNAKTFSLDQFASRLLSRFLQNRIVAEEPVLGHRIVKALEEHQAVRAVEEQPRPSSLTSNRPHIPQIGVL